MFSVSNDGSLFASGRLSLLIDNNVEVRFVIALFFNRIGCMQIVNQYSILGFPEIKVCE
jgi:hypothetical protein